jgi:hypothetical protein
MHHGLRSFTDLDSRFIALGVSHICLRANPGHQAVALVEELRVRRNLIGSFPN